MVRELWIVLQFGLIRTFLHEVILISIFAHVADQIIALCVNIWINLRLLLIKLRSADCFRGRWWLLALVLAYSGFFSNFSYATSPLCEVYSLRDFCWDLSCILLSFSLKFLPVTATTLRHIITLFVHSLMTIVLVVLSEVINQLGLATFAQCLSCLVATATVVATTAAILRTNLRVRHKIKIYFEQYSVDRGYDKYSMEISKWIV